MYVRPSFKENTTLITPGTFFKVSYVIKIT